MTPSGTATAPEYADFESEHLAPVGSLLDRLGLAVLIALAPASIIYLAFNQGGYFPNTTGLAAIAFAAALVARTTLAERPFEGLNRRLGVLLLAFAAFAALQLASALWSHDTARALDEYDRSLLYLLAFTLFGSLPRSSERLRWLTRALAAGMTAVSLAGLLSRVLPHVWPAAVGFYANRLDYPLTYWNAVGLLAGLATILLVYLASSENEHAIVRVVAAFFVPATTSTLLFTFSRGALIVTIVALIAYLVLGRPRRVLGAIVALGPTTAIAARSAYDAQLLASFTPTSRAAVVQGHHVAATIGACMLAAGGLRLATMAPEGWMIGKLAGLRGPHVPSRWVALMAGLAVGGVILGLAVSGTIGREWNSFAHGAPAPSTTRGRLTTLGGEGRVELWHIALDAFSERPLLGYGAGTYQFYFMQHRSRTASTVTDAHDVYVQTLAELGIVGFIPFAVVLFGVLALLAIRIRGPGRTAYAVLFAVVLAWALEAAVDWVWEMPAVTLWLFIAAGAALATPLSAVDMRPTEFRNRTAIALGWMVLAVAPLLVGVSYQGLRASGTELAADNCPKARQDALSSTSFLAVRPEAYEIVSYCDMDLGYSSYALPAARKALHYEPNNWNYEYGLAIALADNGLDPRAAARKALRMNPQEPIVQSEVAAFAKGGKAAWERAAPRQLLIGLGSGALQITNL
jgi:O-antigen ligase